MLVDITINQVYPPGSTVTPQPPYPSQGPGFPTNPIQLPPWAGGWQPRPEHPIFYPPGSQAHPEHPIFYPPPSQGGPQPGHPISEPPKTEPPAGFTWVQGFIPGQGWIWVCVPATPTA